MLDSYGSRRRSNGLDVTFLWAIRENKKWFLTRLKGSLREGELCYVINLVNKIKFFPV